MNDLRKAAQQALEALENVRIEYDYHGNPWDEDNKRIAPAADALRAALAQPEQEPVAWMVYTLDGKSVCVTDNPADFTDGHRALPLYATPPQRKPLTEEEMRLCFTRTNTSEPLSEGWPGLERFARAIEKAHGIGGDV